MPTAIDPICQMKVDNDNPPGGSSEYQGTTYYFCSPGCKVAFEQDPESYLSGPPPELPGQQKVSFFLFAYHSGEIPESPEEGAKRMAKFESWVGGLGDAVVNAGHPLGKSKTVSTSGVSDDGGSNPLVGFSIVKADSMDAALEMAKGYPHLEIGTVEVVEMLE